VLIAEQVRNLTYLEQDGKLRNTLTETRQEVELLMGDLERK